MKLNKITIFSAFFLFAVFVTILISSQKNQIARVLAQGSATGLPVTGYAWSSNIGWISFNCINDKSCSTVNYGVQKVGDSFQGFAWSPNIGWIKFDPTLTGPSYLTSNLTPYGMKAVGSAILGWARACSGTVNGDCVSASRADGWDGWINFPVSDALNTGVAYVQNTNNGNYDIKGFAWGSNVLGWIDMFPSVVGGKVSCPGDPRCPVTTDQTATDYIVDPATGKIITGTVGGQGQPSQPTTGGPVVEGPPAKVIASGGGVTVQIDQSVTDCAGCGGGGNPPTSFTGTYIPAIGATIDAVNPNKTSESYNNMTITPGTSVDIVWSYTGNVAPDSCTVTDINGVNFATGIKGKKTANTGSPGDFKYSITCTKGSLVSPTQSVSFFVNNGPSSCSGTATGKTVAWSAVSNSVGTYKWAFSPSGVVTNGDTSNPTVSYTSYGQKNATVQMNTSSGLTRAITCSGVQMNANPLFKEF